MTGLRRVLKEKRRVVGPIALGLAANLVLYAAALVPLEARVRRASTRAEAARADLAEARARYAAAQAAIERARRASAALQTFYREILPADWSAARRVVYGDLDARARRFRLRPTRTGTESERDDERPLARLGVTMTVAGDYRDIREFLYDLESSDDFIVIDHVSLTQSEQSDAPVVLTIQVSTYYRAEGRGR